MSKAYHVLKDYPHCKCTDGPCKHYIGREYVPVMGEVWMTCRANQARKSVWACRRYEVEGVGA